MKAPFKIHNILPGITEVKYVGGSSTFFYKNSVYPVRKIFPTTILTTDERGEDHTLSIDYLNKNFELVNPASGISDLEEVLHTNVSLRDLFGMDKAYEELRAAVDATIPQVSAESIFNGAVFENKGHYIKIVEFPEQGFGYMRTIKARREWQIIDGSTFPLKKEDMATYIRGGYYRPIKELPKL